MKTETSCNLKRNINLTKVFGFILFIFIATAIVLGLWIKFQFEPVDSSAGDVTVEITPHASTADIGNLLEKKGIIKNSYLFKAYARLTGLDRKLKAGNYVLSPSQNLKEIMDELSKGRVKLITFTIPEGFTVEQIAERLAKKNLVEKERFLELTQNGDFEFPYTSSFASGKRRMEGFLFPDTYKIPDYYQEEDIIQLMLDRFTEVYNSDVKEKAEKIGMSVKEVVTLASIIEREVRVPDERKIVSGVFHNRLAINMPLQSCATVQYVIGETKERLLDEDTKTPSPYNTYLHAGLPPGPIANPGKESLLASVLPEDVEYFYFLAKGDGTHHFSKTLSEHNAAKRKYLK